MAACLATGANYRPRPNRLPGKARIVINMPFLEIPVKSQKVFWLAFDHEPLGGFWKEKKFALFFDPLKAQAEQALPLKQCAYAVLIPEGGIEHPGVRGWGGVGGLRHFRILTDTQHHRKPA